MQIYIDREIYDNLITALLTIDNKSYLDKSDAIKIELGDIADLWPDDIDDDDDNINHDNVDEAANDTHAASHSSDQGVGSPVRRLLCVVVIRRA
jgi:hypothetical protein